MLGISYSELFLILGATAALIGPKDLPRIAKTAGRMAGRAVGYVQLARGQLENAMQHTQFRQVNKDLQDTMAQLEAIRHEIRSISIVNPGPLTRTLMDGDGQTGTVDNLVPPRPGEEKVLDLSTVNHSSPPPPSSLAQQLQQQQQQLHEWRKLNSAASMSKDHGGTTSAFSSTDLHSQATNFAKLAESEPLRTAAEKEDFSAPDESGLLTVLPVSAESAGLLPTSSKGDQTGSDIVLEAVLEAEVARNAKDFFSQPENQIKME